MQLKNIIEQMREFHEKYSSLPSSEWRKMEGVCQFDSVEVNQLVICASRLNELSEKARVAASLNDSIPLLRLGLLFEETAELAEAMSQGNAEKALDALADILYVVVGSAVHLDLDKYLEKAFDEVHNSNMTKDSIKTNDENIFKNKVKKGPNYVPPDIKKVMNDVDEAEKIKADYAI